MKVLAKQFIDMDMLYNIKEHNFVIKFTDWRGDPDSQVLLSPDLLIEKILDLDLCFYSYLQYTSTLFHSLMVNIFISCFLRSELTSW